MAMRLYWIIAGGIEGGGGNYTIIICRCIGFGRCEAVSGSDSYAI